MSKFLKKLTLGEELDNKTITLPYLVLVILLVLSFAVTFLFYQSAKSKDSIRFNNSVTHVQEAIENKIDLYIALLKSARGFVESTGELNREKFANYVKSLELEKNYPGVNGIGFSKIVSPQEKDALVKQMQAEGFTDFGFFPETEKDIYQAIIYFEPLDAQNRKIIGFDMFSDENKREALARARDFGIPAATSKVELPSSETNPKLTLLQENSNNKQAGFLIFLPIYKDGLIPPTEQERKEKLTGYIYSQFQMEDFLRVIEGEAEAGNISLKIYDNEVKPENLLVQTEKTSDSKVILNSALEQDFKASSSVNVAGRRWIMEYSALPPLFEQSNVSWIPFILLSGIVLSFLFFALTYSQALSRQKVQNTAAELFDLEQQKQLLLEKEQHARLIAEQANQTKDEFISVVSHELRTPLNAIAGWAKILKTNNLSQHTKDLALIKIEKNLRSQTVLVEELLDFSQIISGKVNLESKPVDFSSVFEKAFSEMEPNARLKDVVFTKDNRLNGEKVLGDREKIKIIINNLFSNAIKYTAEGGKIEANAYENDGFITLTVKDNGKGISKEFLPHIFDRFRQDDNSPTRFYGGLGLGLAISEHLVKLHHGTIEADSEGDKKGSVFIVKLPSYKP